MRPIPRDVMREAVGKALRQGHAQRIYYIIDGPAEVRWYVRRESYNYWVGRHRLIVTPDHAREWHRSYG